MDIHSGRRCHFYRLTLRLAFSCPPHLSYHVMRRFILLTNLPVVLTTRVFGLLCLAALLASSASAQLDFSPLGIEPDTSVTCPSIDGRPGPVPAFGRLQGLIQSIKIEAHWKERTYSFNEHGCVTSLRQFDQTMTDGSGTIKEAEIRYNEQDRITEAFVYLLRNGERIPSQEFRFHYNDSGRLTKRTMYMLHRDRERFLETVWTYGEEGKLTRALMSSRPFSDTLVTEYGRPPMLPKSISIGSSWTASVEVMREAADQEIRTATFIDTTGRVRLRVQQQNERVIQMERYGREGRLLRTFSLDDYNGCFAGTEFRFSEEGFPEHAALTCYQSFDQFQTGEGRPVIEMRYTFEVDHRDNWTDQRVAVKNLREGSSTFEAAPNRRVERIVTYY